MPLLTREQEAHLFRKYNYLKYKAVEAARGARSGAAEVELDGRDRIAASAGGGDQERNRPGQLAAGGFDRQAARDAGSEFLRAGERWQHVAAAGDREVRLRARQQVQHVRELGDHEELCADDSGRVQASRPVPHEPGRVVRRDARTPRQPAGRRRHSRISAKRRSSGSCVGWTSASRRSSSAGSAWTMPKSRRLSRKSGASLGVTKERIRQIEARASRSCVRRPKRKRSCSIRSKRSCRPKSAGVVLEITPRCGPPICVLG